MLKREWSNLWKSKVFIIVLIAIMTIPTIYTTVFLGSMWDPYGSLEKLPVAIVNEDQAVEYNGKVMNVGDELIENLRENNSLDFNFVSSDVANAGLANGTYYMVVTIPEDFSHNATTLMEETPTKMELKYETNPGTNYIASKMSDSAVSKIRTTIAEKITKQYSETVFEQLSEIGDGLQDATDGTKEIQDGVEQLIDGNDTIKENLELLADSSLTFSDGATELSVALKQYTDGVDAVNDGAIQLSEGINTLEEGTSVLAEGATQLGNGSSSLKQGVTAYTDAVGALEEGTKQLASNNAALNEGVSTLVTGLETLKTGSSSLLTGLNTISTELGTSLSTENKKQLDTLLAGTTTINEGMKQLNTTVQSLDISKVSSAISSVEQGMTAIVSNTVQAGNNLKEVYAEVEQAKAGIAKNEGFQSLSQEDQDAILAYVHSLTSESSSLTKATTNVTIAKTAATTIASELGKVDLSAISGFSTLQESVKTLASGANTVLTNSSAVITKQQQALLAIQTALDREGSQASEMGLIQGMKQINTGLTAAHTALVKADGLQAGLNSYTEGVATVYGAVKELNANSGKLNDGATALSTGINTLTEKLPTLTEGIGKLQSGASSMKDGTGELASNNEKLLDATGQLADGATQISDGAGQLAEGSGTLGEGLEALNDGTTTLHDSLGDAAQEIKDANTTDDTYDMMAAPVELVDSVATNVENNGSAMAAYMMGVGLWVACIAFCIAYPLQKPSREITNPVSWWISKMSIAAVVAVGQALLMVYMLKWTLGFAPVYFGKTVLVAILASLAFMSMMYFFNLLMGKVGSFLLLIFMVLQLGGSAGTYPIELSGSFYQAIHRFMPFTYSVNAFRATVASGQSIAEPIAVFIGITVVFMILTLGVFAMKLKKEKQTK